MSIKSISDIRAQAQAAAKSTVDGIPVPNPYDIDPEHADAWNEAYESAMHELGCFA